VGGWIGRGDCWDGFAFNHGGCGGGGWDDVAGWCVAFGSYARSERTPVSRVVAGEDGGFGVVGFGDFGDGV
jgi:hypothetical protein